MPESAFARSNLHCERSPATTARNEQVFAAVRGLCGPAAGTNSGYARVPVRSFASRTDEQQNAVCHRAGTCELAQSSFPAHDGRSCLTGPNGDKIKFVFQLRSEIPVAKKRAKRRGWTSKDVRELKSMARARTPAREIGRKLGRTEGAVRQKAYAEGVSFNSRTRARRKRRK
jgi:hypothetical protein